jgi:large subunit ribosomal protein L1
MLQRWPLSNAIVSAKTASAWTCKWKNLMLVLKSCGDEAAGADIVGLDDLAETIQGGTIDFDVCIATPSTMRVVGKLGQVLGPRGLMPNPKVGTVTQDVTKAVTNAKAGQVQFRIDKAGVIHCPIGKASFDEASLKENLLALLDALNKAKPSASKGQYLKRLTLSTTMGPGVKVDRASVAG